MKSVFTKTEEEKVGWLGSKNKDWKVQNKERRRIKGGRLEILREMFSGVRAGGFEGSKEGEQGEQDLLSYRLVAFPFLLSWLSLFLLPKNKENRIYSVFVLLDNVSPFKCFLILACSSSLLHSLVFLQHNLLQHIQ